MENQILAMCFDRPISKIEAKNYLLTLSKLESKGLIIFSNGKYVPNLEKQEGPKKLQYQRNWKWYRYSF